MFFSKPGQYAPCGLYTKGHWTLFSITVVLIILAVKYTKTNNKTKIRKIIIGTTLTIWLLEIIKIGLNFYLGNGNNFNAYIPCYYCSLLLYATLLSSVGKGKIQKCGDVFLQTGSIVGGIVFLIFPTTSLTEYPMFHFFSIYSFVYHGIMIYLGIILNKVEYKSLKMRDAIYNVILIVIVSIVAYILNIKLGSNLMFIANPLPNTPLTSVYDITGEFYGLFMILVQALLPFFAVFGILNLIKLKKNKI